MQNKIIVRSYLQRKEVSTLFGIILACRFELAFEWFMRRPRWLVSFVASMLEKKTQKGWAKYTFNLLNELGKCPRTPCVVDRAEVSVIEGLFFNRGVKSVRNWWMSVKSVRDRGVLITELKKETDRGLFFCPQLSIVRYRGVRYRGILLQFGVRSCPSTLSF